MRGIYTLHLVDYSCFGWINMGKEYFVFEGTNYDEMYIVLKYMKTLYHFNISKGRYTRIADSTIKVYWNK